MIFDFRFFIGCTSARVSIYYRILSEVEFLFLHVQKVLVASKNHEYLDIFFFQNQIAKKKEQILSCFNIKLQVFSVHFVHHNSYAKGALVCF